MTSFGGSVGTFTPKSLSKTTETLVADSAEEAGNPWEKQRKPQCSYIFNRERWSQEKYLLELEQRLDWRTTTHVKKLESNCIRMWSNLFPNVLLKQQDNQSTISWASVEPVIPIAKSLPGRSGKYIVQKALLKSLPSSGVRPRLCSLRNDIKTALTSISSGKIDFTEGVKPSH